MKKNKGITLVALVVTIVVLLILAGVSINLVLGNNGIIAKAKDAETKSAEASQNDLKGMNYYMNKVALATFSYFDTGKNPSETLEPERFYHGFVLGLIVELSDRYEVKSNRESGFGRYDVMIIPLDKSEKAIVLEFKVHENDEEKTLEETVSSALAQIEEKKYDTELINAGVKKENIRHYGFAFEGKKVLIGTDE